MGADSAQAADDDAIIADYLTRVRPAGRRRRQRGRQRGWPRCERGGGASAAVVRLGDPAALVRAIDGHVPGTEARWLELAAVLLVLAGGVLWRPTWLVGLTLLWISPRWLRPDKLLATLVWPGGLLTASLLTVRYTALGLFAGGGFASLLPGARSSRAVAPLAPSSEAPSTAVSTAPPWLVSLPDRLDARPFAAAPPARAARSGRTTSRRGDPPAAAGQAAGATPGSRRAGRSSRRCARPRRRLARPGVTGACVTGQAAWTGPS